jgi:hypothetical protein
LPPINELKPLYQPKNNGIRAGRENGESGHLSAHDTRRRPPSRRRKSIPAGA